MQEAEVIAFLEKKAAMRWELAKEPYYVAQFPNDLKEERGIDYRTIISEEIRLKEFVNEKQKDSNFSVVQHPTQKAKFGIVPKGSSYSFESSRTETVREKSPHNGVSGRKALLQFMDALSKFDDADLNEVVIPTKLMVRLFSDR